MGRKSSSFTLPSKKYFGYGFGKQGETTKQFRVACISLVKRNPNHPSPGLLRHLRHSHRTTEALRGRLVAALPYQLQSSGYSRLLRETRWAALSKYLSDG